MDTYLKWLVKHTPTRWWHDSAIPEEIDRALDLGALGVTTNPVLTYKSLQAVPEFWAESVAQIREPAGPERAEALLKLVATYAAGKLRGIFEATGGEHGYAFGQLNPALCGSANEMLEQAIRLASWAPNVAVKLPTTRAALPVIEELSALGIAVCATLNFSVAQAIAAADAHERGIAKAKRAGISPRPCFVVQQGGRLDDYLTECAQDSELPVSREDIQQAGNAVSKKTFRLFQQRGYHSTIMPAGLRGVHHLTSLAGGEVVFSLQSRVQRIVTEAKPECIPHIHEAVNEGVLRRLLLIPEFARAYCTDKLRPEEFITYGVAQKTLSQFLWTGWAPLETYGISGTSDRWF